MSEQIRVHTINYVNYTDIEEKDVSEAIDKVAHAYGFNEDSMIGMDLILEYLEENHPEVSMIFKSWMIRNDLEDFYSIDWSW